MCGHGFFVNVELLQVLVGPEGPEVPERFDLKLGNGLSINAHRSGHPVGIDFALKVGVDVFNSLDQSFAEGLLSTDPGILVGDV